MKKCFSIMICVVLIFSAIPFGVFTTASAASVIREGKCGDNVDYTFDTDGVLTISGSGKMYDYSHPSSSDNNKSPFNRGIIKDAVKIIHIEQGVTTIGWYTFNNITNKISITIPDSVNSIGNGAFTGCTGLENISIPNSVGYIGTLVFCGCTGLTSVTIPGSVTTIEYSAFSGCTGLTNLNILFGVKTIKDHVFSGCTGLTEITIPDSVTSISYGAFSNCTGLRKVTIPGSLTSISFDMFRYCTSLESVSIQDGVTTISSNVFDGCNRLKSISIPPSVNSINYSAIPNNTVIIGVADSYAKVWAEAYNRTFISVTNDYFDPNHVHDYKTEVINAPTCTTSGSQNVTCSVCRYYYSEVLEPIGHDYGAWTNLNATQHKRVCGNNASHIETADHTWNSGTVTTVATCKSTGARTFNCTVCGAVKTEKIAINSGNHTGGTEIRNIAAATCGADGYTGDTYCTDCGVKLISGNTIPATGNHIWNDGTVTTEPTCLKTGIKTYTCEVCGNTKSEIIQKLEHSLEHVHNPSTCTVKGADYDICTNDCDDNFYNYTELDLLPHTWDDGVVTVSAVCIKNGVKTFTCKDCGETKTEIIPANGEHVFGEWSNKINPTYKDSGKSERTCTVCGYVEERILDPIVPDYIEHDDPSGVEIGYQEDTYGKEIEFEVTNIFDGDSFNFLNKEKGNFDFRIYDIKTKSGNEELQPNGKVLVKLPIPANYDRSKLRIYHVTNTGVVEPVDIWIDGDYACFETEHFSAYALVDESKTVAEYGDVDGNGQILANDARIALRASAKLETLDGKQRYSADVDGDGQVLAGDARQILRYSAKLQKEFKKS